MKNSLARTLAAMACIGAGFALAGGAAMAQTFNGPIKIIVPFAAGGSPDIQARLLANYAVDLGVPVVVENRTGAAGNIGFDAGAKAAPDGRTLLLCTLGCATNGFIYRSLTWDVQRDLRPVVLVGKLPSVLVVTRSLPVSTAQEFIELAKQRPGQVNMASSGIGTSGHLANVLFQHLAGVQIQDVPFRGSGVAVNDIVSGQVESTITSLPDTVPLVRAGLLKALAVTTKQRVPIFPDVPTFQEVGLKDYEVVAWSALFVPKATPDAIVAKLHSAFSSALNDPALKTRFTELSIEPGGGSPEDLNAFLQAEIMRWEPIIKARGLKVE